MRIQFVWSLLGIQLAIDTTPACECEGEYEEEDEPEAAKPKPPAVPEKKGMAAHTGYVIHSEEETPYRHMGFAPPSTEWP